MNAHTRLSVHAVSPDPSLLLHMHINGRICDIFIQPIFRLEEACMQACQSLHCSRTCTKWAYIWHIPSVNAQTRLSIHAVSPEPSLLSNMHINGRIYKHILSANAQTRSNMHAVLSVPSLLSHMHKMGVHMAYSISNCSDAPEPSLLSHMHKMGVHMAYSFSECSYAPEHGRSLVRAFAARTLTKCM